MLAELCRRAAGIMNSPYWRSRVKDTPEYEATEKQLVDKLKAVDTFEQLDEDTRSLFLVCEDSIRLAQTPLMKDKSDNEVVDKLFSYYSKPAKPVDSKPVEADFEIDFLNRNISR